MTALHPVAGGDISRAYRLETSAGALFLKWRPDAPAGFFAAEAQGLELLARARSAGGPRLPRPIAWEDDFLVLEWIQSGSGDAAAELGRQLACLHRSTAPEFGLAQDNFIGLLPQGNGPLPSWAEFYAQRRLRAQAAEARRRGRWGPEREERLEAICARLEDWLPDEPPALVHGDLWAGNCMTAASGEPVLVDPAPYYGSREVDLAMSELFGGFAPAFYAAYHQAFPQQPGWPRRRDLYQLYYLLVHLNHFGEAYGRGVDAALARLAA